jgi:hypothetical protein
MPSNRYDSIRYYVEPNAKEILYPKEIDKLVKFMVDEIFDRNWNGQGTLISRCCTDDDQAVYILAMEAKGKGFDYVILLTRKDLYNSHSPELSKLLDDYDEKHSKNQVATKKLSDL